MKKRITKKCLLTLLGIGLISCGGEINSDSTGDTGSRGSSATTETVSSSSSDIASSESSSEDIASSSTSEGTSSDSESETPSINYGTATSPLTIAEAIALTNSLGDTSLITYSKEIGYITGYVVSSSYNSTYKNYSLTLVDDLADTSSTYTVYRGVVASEDLTVYAGDTVVASGYMAQYYKTPELTPNNSVNPTIISVTHNEYDITSSIENGTIAGLTEKGMSGSTYSFTVSANKGYKIESVKANGKDLIADETTSEYSFTVTGNMSIIVKIVSEDSALPISAELKPVNNNQSGTYLPTDLNLSSDVFTVSYTQGDTNTQLNVIPNNHIRMYSNKAAIGNTLEISLLDSTKLIKSISINFVTNYSSTAVIYAGTSTTAVSAENGLYNINASSFKIVNDNAMFNTIKATQVRFTSISIEYYA